METISLQERRISSMMVDSLNYNPPLEMIFNKKKLYRGAEKCFFQSSPVDEYHLPQINSEKVFLGAGVNNFELDIFLEKFIQGEQH
jgi:hypothetical protein